MILMLEIINPVKLKTIKIWLCDGYIVNTPVWQVPTNISVNTFSPA